MLPNFRRFVLEPKWLWENTDSCLLNAFLPFVNKVIILCVNIVCKYFDCRWPKFRTLPNWDAQVPFLSRKKLSRARPPAPPEFNVEKFERGVGECSKVLATWANPKVYQISTLNSGGAGGANVFEKPNRKLFLRNRSKYWPPSLD